MIGEFVVKYALFFNAGVTVCSILLVVIIAVFLKRLYKQRIIQYMNAGPGSSNYIMPASTPDEQLINISISTFTHANWLAADWKRRWVESGVRWVVYIISGLLIMYVLLRFITPVAAFTHERFGSAAVWIISLILLILIPGRYVLAFSGVWIVAFFIGSILALVLVTVIVLMIFSIQSVIAGEMSLFGVVLGFGFMASIFYFFFMIYSSLLAFFYLIYELISKRFPISPSILGLSFLWAFACYFISYLEATNPYTGLYRVFLFFVLPFLAYIAISALLFLAISKLRTKREPYKLLFLRTFSGGKRSYRLLRSLANKWLQQGSIYALSGADIVKAIMDPEALFLLLKGELNEALVHRESDFHIQLQNLDELQRLDGLFSMEEFRCINEVWKTVFLELLNRSHVVVMDLRGFGYNSDHLGTSFEIDMLVRSGQIQKACIVIDQRTDISRFRKIAEHAYQETDLNDVSNEIILFETVFSGWKLPGWVYSKAIEIATKNGD